MPVRKYLEVSHFQFLYHQQSFVSVILCLIPNLYIHMYQSHKITGNVKPLSIFLQASIDEGIDEDSERQAKELLVKLAEYKPLAKIEELEEQNYNMIDDRLNNGVEKFNREEEKKEQREKPQARSSLKERLVAKQKEVAQGKNKDAKEQDKTKKTNREEI